MALLLTLDASVFVAACRRREPGHDASHALLRWLRDQDIPLIEPAILPVETAAALVRTGDDPVRATEFAEALLSLPLLTLVTIDDRHALRAVTAATEYRLRGTDALYVATALHYGSQLITLDKEQLKRAPNMVHACKPDTAIERFT